jgi:hypothetical protein
MVMEDFMVVIVEVVVVEVVVWMMTVDVERESVYLYRRISSYRSS